MKNNAVKAVFVMLVLALAVLSACGTPEEAESAEPAVLTVMTHDSFAASEEVIAGFEAEYGVELRFVKAGDTGAALNKAILSKSAPLADVFFGVDNNFLSRALEEDLFVAYNSPLLEEIPDVFELDAEHRVLPVDYGDVCINYDKVYFAEQGLAVPTSLDDLTKPEYAELLAVENPATSSPGLAFLLATIAEYGDPGYLGYWAALRENGVMVVSDWETAYYGNFSASSGHRLQPAGGSDLRRDRVDRSPDCLAGGREHVLPAGGVCRHPQGHRTTGAGKAIYRLHARADLPGRCANADVRFPGERECCPA